MARTKATSEYVCQSCAATFVRWEGRCRGCGAWNSLVETLVAPSQRRPSRDRAGSAAAAPTPRPIGDLEASGAQRIATGLVEVDRLLGGGVVPGSVVLLGGEPGIGKSTLVLQVAGAMAARMAAGGGTALVLYASAEESAAQLHLRAERLGLLGGAAAGALHVLAGTDVMAIIAAAAATPPALLVVDSIQTVEHDGLEGPPGSVGQVRECTIALGALARAQGIPILLVGHVTKDGSLAGPRTLEHLVDAVFMLEGDRYGSLRLLRALKNRHGSTEEVGVMEMSGVGLREVSDPAGAFLGDGPRSAPGMTVTPVLEGTRPLLVEVQALVAPAGMGPPRRTVSGLDGARLALLIAVLARRGGIDVSNRDVYASLAGGLTANEPALDLPLALAVAASYRDSAVPGDTVVCGELSLLGEVRPVRGLERRLREAARLGFRRALIPAAAGGGSEQLPREMELVRVPTLKAALEVTSGNVTGTSG